MGKPAARQTDATSHGGEIQGAAANVIVNGRGAVRLQDDHVCPAQVPVPHVGGRVRFGGGAALTVLVNRRPAVALDGATTCTNAPLLAANVVARGSENVFFAVSATLAGLPVTESADGALHIGKAIVITNDPNDPAYQSKVLGDLCKIASTDVGQRRLRSIDGSGKTVTIVPLASRKRGRNAYAAPDDPRDAEAKSAGGTGEGSDVEVRYSPSYWPPEPGADPTGTGADGDAILFHELVHADHQTHGTADSTKRPDDYDTQEEFNTIEDDGENAYRKARGMRERHTHHGV